MIFLFNVQFLLFHKCIFYACLRSIIIVFGRNVNGYPLCGNRGRFKHKGLANQRVSYYSLLLHFLIWYYYYFCFYIYYVLN